jgi:hypothetical protein
MPTDAEIVKAMARVMFGDLHWTEQSRQTAQAALAAQRAMGLVLVPVDAVRLLKRYREETPPGHSPHMICQEVDRVLAMIAAAQGEG